MLVFDKIESVAMSDEKRRLQANVMDDDKSKTYWIQVDAQYGDYLCVERYDAFLVAFLLYAMKEKKDIEIRGTVSEKLYYQLTTFYVPALAQYTKMYHSIKIVCERLDATVLPTRRKVGTGLSCGVDSMHAIFQNLNLEAKNFNLTSLVSFNVGHYGDDNALSQKRYRLHLEKLARPFAQDLKMELLEIDTNLMEIPMPFRPMHTLRAFATIMALQKYFSKYYYASGHSFYDYALDDTSDSANFDLLNVHCFTTENLDFYSMGAGISRFEKIRAIADIPSVQNNLRVCLRSFHNCGHCEKCLRTMFALFSLGKLDAFDRTFNLDDFHKHMSARLAFLIKNRRKVFYKESWAVLKKNNVAIPRSTYLKVYRLVFSNAIVHTAKIIRSKFAAIPWLKKWYRKLFR